MRRAWVEVDAQPGRAVMACLVKSRSNAAHGSTCGGGVALWLLFAPFGAHEFRSSFKILIGVRNHRRSGELLGMVCFWYSLLVLRAKISLVSCFNAQSGNRGLISRKWKTPISWCSRTGKRRVFFLFHIISFEEERSMKSCPYASRFVYRQSHPQPSVPCPP